MIDAKCWILDESDGRHRGPDVGGQRSGKVRTGMISMNRMVGRSSPGCVPCTLAIEACSSVIRCRMLIEGSGIVHRDVRLVYNLIYVVPDRKPHSSVNKFEIRSTKYECPKYKNIVFLTC